MKNISSNKKVSFQTARMGVKGLGGGHGHATSHFVGQRVTAIAAIPLSFIMLYIFFKGFFAPYKEAFHLVHHPFFAISIVLFSLVVLYHMKLGMSMVVTDYIHSTPFKITALIKNVFFCGVLAVTILYSVCAISFGSLS